ncbi:MAG: hypothetical protein ABSE84_01610 [Isosphaeraceae bacterium]|jgi:hypothetical protein
MNETCRVSRNDADLCGREAKYVYAGEIQVCDLHAKEIRSKGGAKFLQLISPAPVMTRKTQNLERGMK